MKRSAHNSLRLLLIILIVPLIPAWGQNPIVVENQNSGSTNWNLNNTGSDAVGQIKGYASAVSINKGESITFFVSVNPAQTFTIDVYRLGWYGGAGGRLMQHVDALQGTQQATCPTDPTLGTIVCTWDPSFTLAVPDTWTSGIFVAVLNNAAGFQNYIVFVVRDDSRTADLLYQLGVNTLQAYNNWPNDNNTGKSLYNYNSFGATTITGTTRAAKVSFDRPYRDDGSGGLFYWQLWELYLIQWLEKNGYNVAYSTDLDTHLNGSRLLNFKGFMSAGHNEYWSKPMYDNVQSARDNGVNLAFFGANAIYWQVRYEPSAAGVPNRILVCYKDPSIDPVQGSTTTVQWRDALLNRPEQALMGVQFSDENGSQNFPYVVTNSSSWVYGNTDFTDGSSVPGIVGYEWDRFDSNFPSPPAVAGSWTLLGNSPSVTDAGSADSSNSSIYQAQSGAWVFASGTMSWSSGLSASGLADPRIQQATTNVLNRFITGSSTTSFTLTVTKSGTGTGTVTSSPAGISCGPTCSANFDSGAVVNLTATPDSGSTFAGWSGACSGTGACSVTMDAAKSVSANFTASPGPFSLTVAKSGTGTGTVTSTPSGISCGTTCSASFASGTVVNLTATPDSASTFAGWSGACSGTGACSVTMDAAKSVSATFNSNPPAALSSITVSPTSVIGGNSSTGTLTLTRAAVGNVVVTLSSNNASATVPPSVTVPQGATTASFSIGTTPVASSTVASISAVYNGVTKTATLTIARPTLSSLKLNPSKVVGGNPSTGTVTLSGAAPPTGMTVQLSSNRTTVATVPSSVTVAAGATTATFTVTTIRVRSTTNATISGTSAGVTKSAVLSVTR
jgi:N,N-dimethylformamidase beta subunit-like protein/List-Bact-rpt repeat protein